MDQNFWIKKWQDGEIRFHQFKFHPMLEKFAEKFTKGTILVPLCGKTLDMIYLSLKGHHVIGVELSLIACRDFFKENSIEYSEHSKNGFVVFESEKIILWCGDFFNLPQEVWDEVTGIYDRAALVALPPDIRQKYSATMLNRSKQETEMLLISLEYPESAMQGPPFSVEADEVSSLYKGFSFNQIYNMAEELRSIPVTNTVYWLKK